jgi:hypothetical protein
LAPAAIAGLGTCALFGCSWWSARDGVPRLEGPAGFLTALLIVAAFGIVAGAVSGRRRDFPATWIAAVIGAIVAYLANYAIDPTWPRSETPFAVWVAMVAIILLPVMAGSYFVGTAVANGTARRAVRI